MGTAVSAPSRSVQMNIRIGGQLKQAGDDVLSRLGLTPSAAVRGLWEFLVAHQESPEAIRAVVEPASMQSESDERQEKLRAIQHVRSQYAQLARSLGIEGASPGAEPAWDELRDAMYDARIEGSL